MTLQRAAEVVGTTDFSLAIGPTRLLVARGTILSLRDGGGARWSIPIGTGRVLAAALLFDGRAAAVHVSGRNGRDLILVIGLRDGATERRIIVDNARVTFAPRVGLAIAYVPRERLIAIDLRLGRVIANRTIEPAIANVTLDGAGRAIEMWNATGDVVARIELPSLQRLASGTQPPPIAEATEVEHAPSDGAELAVEYGSTQPSGLITDSAPMLATEAAPIVATDDAPIAVAGGEDTVIAPPLELDPPSRPTQPLDEVLSTPPGLPARFAIGYLRGLPLHMPRATATPTENARILGAFRDRARAFAALAIARAWDDGRLAFEHGDLPHREQVAGLSGAPGGLAVDEVADAMARTIDSVAACADAVSAIAPRWSPLTIVAGELALSQLAQDILIAIAAPQLWSDVARLYGMLGRGCDAHLLGTLLAELADPIAVAAELEPDAPLRALGLVREARGWLTVDRVVLRILRGIAPLGDLAPIVQPRLATRTLDELHIREDVIRFAIAELERAPAPLRIVVRGRDGGGGSSLIAALVEATGHTLCTIDAIALLREPKTCAGELAIALQRVRIAGFVPCVRGLDRIPTDDARLRGEIRAVLAAHRGPLALRCGRDAQPLVDGGHVLVDLPALTPTERRAAWAASLARARVCADSDLLADRYAIAPGVIARVLATVEPCTDRLAATEAIDRAVGKHLETQLGAVATRIERLAPWSQVVLPPDIEDSITELIARIRHRATVFDTWGFDAVMSTSRGVTALFQGGPGTGKTLVAGAIARELGVELYRVDVSKIMSKWIGETEQNLARLFDAAEDSHAMLLFDEADSLFAKRTEVKTSVDRYANAEVNYLLQRLDSFEGIAIMATNFGSSIDSAFKRRLSFRLTFPFPDDEQRERLWRAHVPSTAPIADDIDFAAIARRFQLSGGYIRNCALRAAFLAAAQGGTITGELLERAIKAEFREIGKLAQTGALE